MSDQPHPVEPPPYDDPPPFGDPPSRDYGDEDDDEEPVNYDELDFNRRARWPTPDEWWL